MNGIETWYKAKKKKKLILHNTSPITPPTFHHQLRWEAITFPNSLSVKTHECSEQEKENNPALILSTSLPNQIAHIIKKSYHCIPSLLLWRKKKSFLTLWQKKHECPSTSSNMLYILTLNHLQMLFLPNPKPFFFFYNATSSTKAGELALSPVGYRDKEITWTRYPTHSWPRQLSCSTSPHFSPCQKWNQP